MSDEALRQQTPRDERRAGTVLGLAIGDALGATSALGALCRPLLYPL